MTTIFYISIIMTVLSLMLTILAYYGITRYCRLRYYEGNCKCLSETYVNLERVESPEKVVVSMYSKSSDIGKNLTLKSILDQTVHPDQIIIVTDDKGVDVPDFLKKDSIITLQTAGEMGRTGAIIKPLQSQKNSNTKIIVLTDGVVYGPDFIETIVEESVKYPGSVIFVEGYSAKKYVDGKMVKSDNGDVINTSAGVLVSPSMFTKYVDVGKSSVLGDAPNAVLSTMILKNNIPCRKIRYSEIFHVPRSVEPNEKTALEYFAEYYKL